MRNLKLAKDHVDRAEKRLKAIQTLFGEEAWADVVRESQETVELALKGLLKNFGVEVPRVHDVSGILEQEAGRLPKALRGEIPVMMEISKSLRRDRELAFYGSDDLTPSEFYTRKEAEDALTKAETVVRLVRPHV